VKHSIQKRLQSLEKINAFALKPRTAPSGPSVAEIIRERLRTLGIEQGPKESLAETTARAVGMSCSELHDWLRVRAGV